MREEEKRLLSWWQWGIVVLAGLCWLAGFVTVTLTAIETKPWGWAILYVAIMFFLYCSLTYLTLVLLTGYGMSSNWEEVGLRRAFIGLLFVGLMLPFLIYWHYRTDV
jgi:ABC-type nickel/cobalt efflux system permease component RcnA